MSLIQLQHVDLGMGGPLLLNDINLVIEPGERVCIVGRNGAGKSTLMKLIAGDIEADDGKVLRKSGIVVSRMAQEVPQHITGSIFHVICAGLGDLGQLLTRYQDAVNSADLNAISALQQQLDTHDGWNLEQRVKQLITRMELPEHINFDALSGGLKRRILLAQALVSSPDVLLLDEPTNHLDLEAIQWLEQFMTSWSGAIIFITHDRSFLRALATRIVEIDRGTLTDWPGDYDNYLRRREERLHAESKANTLFDKKLAQEEAWIRQGIKARRTRNEGRVRALKARRVERAQRRDQIGNVKMATGNAAISGKKVIELEHVHHSYAGHRLLDDLSTTILRGDRVGIIGPNGSGKSSLLKIMLNQIQPDQGKAILGSGLKIAYFDQYRAQLDDRLDALDNVAEGRQFLEINGERQHIVGYLKNFLFSPDRLRLPITRFSGGERNRLLLAKLFAQPSNLLIMDEPTNDLDVETLELLEELLTQYTGTVLLVSHDRAFLDNVVTSTLVLEGDGKVGEYVGGYTDWKRQSSVTTNTSVQTHPVSHTKAISKSRTISGQKLGYKEKRELEQLPGRIEELEKAIKTEHERMSQADFFHQDSTRIVEAQQALTKLQQELDQAYARWMKLEH